MRVGRGKKITRWAKRGLLGLGMTVAALAATGAVYQAASAEVDERRYPPPGEMVDVGGRELHINCAGEGSPTVLLESGRGENSLVWSRVQPGLAEATRVCAYDRAGLGWSEPSPAPRDSRHAAEELHRLLENAGIGGPYVYVGHSLGGFGARVFAGRYPGEVAGVVLVDSASEDEPGAVEEPAAGHIARPGYREFAAGVRSERRRAALQFASCRYLLSPLGVMRLFRIYPELDLPARVRAEAEAVFYRTSVCATAARELDAYAESAAQARAAGSLGDVPLAVLSAGAQPESGRLSPEEAEREKRSQVFSRALQDGLVGLSSNGEHVVAKKSGHHVQIDQPDLVVDATLSVVAQARRGEPDQEQRNPAPQRGPSARAPDTRPG